MNFQKASETLKIIWNCPYIDHYGSELKDRLLLKQDYIGLFINSDKTFIDVVVKLPRFSSDLKGMHAALLIGQLIEAALEKDLEYITLHMDKTVTFIKRYLKNDTRTKWIIHLFLNHPLINFNYKNGKILIIEWLADLKIVVTMIY